MNAVAVSRPAARTGDCEDALAVSSFESCIPAAKEGGYMTADQLKRKLRNFPEAKLTQRIASAR